MANCFFEDAECTINVKPLEIVRQDEHGYCTIVQILRKDIVKLLKIGVLPDYDSQKDIFTLRVKVTVATKFHINGLRIYDIFDEKLQQIPIDRILIREIGIKKYSEKTKYFDKYYATRLILHLKMR